MPSNERTALLTAVAALPADDRLELLSEMLRLEAARAEAEGAPHEAAHLASAARSIVSAHEPTACPLLSGESRATQRRRDLLASMQAD